jgi:hypothetical protein
MCCGSQSRAPVQQWEQKLALTGNLKGCEKLAGG